MTESDITTLDNGMLEERRLSKRIQCKFPIRISEDKFDILTESVNISDAGVYCRVRRLLPLMSKIEVMLFVASNSNGRVIKKIMCKGIVVRIEPAIVQNSDKAHYNVAIFWTQISKRDKMTLKLATK